MKNNLIIFFISDALIFLLAACSGNGKTASSSSSASSVASSSSILSSSSSSVSSSLATSYSHSSSTIPTYTVTYNPNKAKGGKVPTDPNNYTNGEAATVLSNSGSLVNTGSIFAGWNTKADGTGTSYAAGTTFIVNAANITFYSIWLPHNLSFSSSGKSIVIEGHSSAPIGDLVIPDGVTIVGWNAFINCSSLTGVTIPSTLAGIGDSAFDGCTNLVSVIIPSNVTSIGNYAFYSCTGLTNVTVKGRTPPGLEPGSKAFNLCHAGLQIHVPAGTLISYQSATGWSDYASIIVSP